MKVMVRLLRNVYEEIGTDLSRPHSFAGERVGFLFGRTGNGRTTTLLLVTSYLSVEDDGYVPNEAAGARINSGTIRGVMQRALTTGEVVLHVHVHEHRGAPRFSSVDERELARLVPAFARVSADVPHGALVLSRDSAAAMVWLPGALTPQHTQCISVVGYPMRLGGDT
jgi:hypothetical protein